MNARRLASAVGLVLVATGASAQVVSRTVGSVTFRADLTHARPGGVIIARLASKSRLGTAYAVLDGRRAPFFPSRLGPRALVPVPVDSPGGPNTLGFELSSRRGRQRIPMEIQIGSADYPPRSVTIPEARRGLLSTPGVVTESRRLLMLLRTLTPALVAGLPLRPPLGVSPAVSFGSPQNWVGGSPVEELMDAVYGDRHRGLDFEGAAGMVATAPAAGTVLFAGSRTLTGGTVVIDHGQGIVSLLAHLAREDASEGQRLEAGAPVGLVGDTGLVHAPHLHWAVYLHGIAVDPRVLLALSD